MSGPVPTIRAIPDLPGLWRGRIAPDVPVVATGHSSLDAVLPGHGWPLGVLIELMPRLEGIGELRLLIPALQRLAQDARRIVFIGPPYVLYPPALANAGVPLSRVVRVDAPSDADRRWAAEQILRAGCVGAVVLWSPVEADMPLRRLQLAASEGQALAFLYRPARCLRQPSPAPLRLSLQPAVAGLQIDIAKTRGGRSGGRVLVPHRRFNA